MFLYAGDLNVPRHKRLTGFFYLRLKKKDRRRVRLPIWALTYTGNRFQNGSIDDLLRVRVLRLAGFHDGTSCQARVKLGTTRTKMAATITAADTRFQPPASP